MISTGSIYTLDEHLCLTILNRRRRLLPDDQRKVDKGEYSEQYISVFK